MSTESTTWSDYDIKPRCGVYMLMLGDVVQYIGQSTNIASRLNTHRLEGRIEFDSVRIAEVAPEKLNDTERSLIRKHQPPCNYVNTERAKLPRVGKAEIYPSSVRWFGDNYEHAKQLACLEDRSLNQWLNIVIERLWNEAQQSNSTKEAA